MLAFEIVAKKADIRFYVSVPNKIVDLVEKTIYGFYPSADILHVDEPNIFSENGKVAHGAMITKEQTGYLPLKTYRDIPKNIVHEVIVVDDESKDETVKVARKLKLTTK